MAIHPGISEQGSLRVGYLELPFIVMQDADNSVSIMMGRAIDKKRFAQIEIFVDDSGKVIVRVMAPVTKKALFVGPIGNVMHPDMGKVTEDTTVLEG